jgi:hypothetical protein
MKSPGRWRLVLAIAAIALASGGIIHSLFSYEGQQLRVYVVVFGVTALLLAAGWAFRR